MKLSEYIQVYTVDVVKLAKKLGIHQLNIWRLVRGYTKGKGLRLKLAFEIEKETQGIVTCKDLYDEFCLTEYDYKKTKKNKKKNNSDTDGERPKEITVQAI